MSGERDGAAEAAPATRTLDEIFAGRDAALERKPDPVAAQPAQETTTPAADANAAPPADPQDGAAQDDTQAARDDRTRDEHGRFAKGDPAVALRQERERSKSLEREKADLAKRLAELEAKAAQPQQQPAAQQPAVQNQQPRQPAKMPDPAVDPEGFEQWLYERDRQRDLAVKEEAALAKFGQEKVKSALDQAEAAIRAGGPSMEWLYRRIMGARDPFAEAIAWAAEEQARAAIGPDMNIDALKEKIREELRAEMAAASPQQQPASQPAAQQPGIMPSNLGGVRSAGNSGTTAWTGPRTLDEIFAGRG